jgi:hypothetical protein
VDEGDRDPTDLFFYMRLALQSFERSRRARVDLPSFSATVKMRPFARRFFEAFFARLPSKSVVVLDDYHLAPASSQWQVAVRELLRGEPTILPS